MGLDAPKVTPPAFRRTSAKAGGGGDKGSKSNGDELANSLTPVSVLGALPSPFGSAGPPSSCEAPRTRRQTRLSAAAVAQRGGAPSAEDFSPLAAGLGRNDDADPGFLPRTQSSHSRGDKVTAASTRLLDPTPSLLHPETFCFSRAFDFERVIGRSELSEVWLARHRATGKRYAVKKTSTSGASAAPSSKRAANEVKVVSSVPPHENLVQTIRSWRESGGGFIQMEYCRGGTLAEAAARAARRSRREGRRRRSGGGEGGPPPAALPEAAVWRVALHLSRALEALHAARVIHLDVKPENVYLSWEEAPSSTADDADERENEGELSAPAPRVVLKLGDFGLSVPADPPSDGSELRWEEGDGRYCAPELLSMPSSSPPQQQRRSGGGGPATSPSRPTEAADVFSLGASLFECATGSPPPKGPPLSEEEIASAVVASFPGRDGPSESATATTTEVLAALVASAMRPDPLERPTAAQLARAAAEGERRCAAEAEDEEKGRRRETADEALAAGLPLPLSPTASLALLRRDARRRGYTLDGSMSLSVDDEGGGDDVRSGGGDEGQRGGTARESDDGDSDEDDDAPFSERPPSAPRAGHSRRRTPRSEPQSPEKPSTLSPPPLLQPTAALPPRFLPSSSAAAAPQPARLSLERALSSMSIDGGASADAANAPLPPLPPQQPLPSSFAPRRYGFGLRRQPNATVDGGGDALPSSMEFDGGRGSSLDEDEELAETVRQLSMSASGQLVLPPAPPPKPTTRGERV